MNHNVSVQAQSGSKLIVLYFTDIAHILLVQYSYTFLYKGNPLYRLLQAQSGSKPFVLYSTLLFFLISKKISLKEQT
jgi:hypothetical protein